MSTVYKSGRFGGALVFGIRNSLSFSVAVCKAAAAVVLRGLVQNQRLSDSQLDALVRCQSVGSAVYKN